MHDDISETVPSYDKWKQTEKAMSARKQCWVLLALETNANLLKPSDITRLNIQKF